MPLTIRFAPVASETILSSLTPLEVDAAPPSTRCEASYSPDCGVGEKAQDGENGQCDEHPDYDRRTICLRRAEHVECAHRQDCDQGDADRE